MTRWMMAALTLLPAFATAATMPKPDLRTALLQTDLEWSKVAAAGKDIEKIVSYWTDDAVIYPPREAAISGKAAIRNYVSASLKAPFFSISWKPAQAVVAASGDLGYTMGSNEITFADAKGKVVRSQGRYLTTWRRGPDGAWKCVVDFWNESPFPPPPVAKTSPVQKATPARKPSPKPIRR